MATPTAVSRPAGTAPTAFPTDDPVLARVLKVYKPDCQYLKTATVELTDEGLVRARCAFAIPAPFYIDDTGHFNAVEFNLCYNQMMYYTVAKTVKEGLLEPFAHWTMDDYWRRQLPDFLIVDFHSSFAKGMKAHHFHGEITFRTVRERAGGRNLRPMVVADTAVRYWDDDGGHCTGEVRLVIVNPPARETGSTDGDH
ncbi:FcoT family thioesterase [Streptomyces sp. NPDC026672]|uniref:FcoT family thioesterase n=1 Tax=unclassified Streptomyces TaxID=2593676 RepID=UPI003406AE82